MKRLVVLAVVAVLLFPQLLSAQPNRDPGSRSAVKILVGAGALVVGVAIAARSSNSTTVNGPLGTSTTSSFSTSQLVTGLSIAGVGGIVLWDGLRRHDHVSPATRIGVQVGRNGAAVLVRHNLR